MTGRVGRRVDRSRRRWRTVALSAPLALAGLVSATLVARSDPPVQQVTVRAGDDLEVRCDGRRLETVDRDRTTWRGRCHGPTPTSTTVPPTTRPPTTTTTTPAPGPDPWVRPSQTGFRVPESSLRVVGTPGRCLFASELGVSDGGTITGYRIRGILALDRRNLRVVDNWLEEGVRVTLGCGVGGAGAGAVVEHNEIGPRDRLILGGNAIGDGHYTARYNNIHGFEDGCRCNGNVVFEYNWVHDLAGGPGAHNDPVQLTDNGDPAAGWGGPTLIRFNWLENPFTQTGVITLGADTGPVRWPVIIEGNRIDGGGYSLYGGWSPNPANDPTDLRIINNTWFKSFWPCGGHYGPVIYLPRPGRYTWSGNRWADGRELTPSGPAC